MIKEAVAVDDETVLFRLHAPFADLPATVAYKRRAIIPAAIAQGDLARLSRESIGTGPFKLVSYEPDRLIVVARNEHYFIPEQPYLDRIEIRVYPDPIGRDLGADLGRQRPDGDHGAERVPPGSRACAASTPCRCRPASSSTSTWGATRSPSAIRACARRCRSASTARRWSASSPSTAGKPGNDVPVNSIYQFFKKEPAKKPDIAEAKKLLAEAGYPDGIDLTLVASDNPGTRTQLAVAMREMAKPAGFRITVQTMPHATYLDQVWKKGPFYVGFYNTQQTVDGVFTLLYTSNAAWNETRWNNAGVRQAGGRGAAQHQRRGEAPRDLRQGAGPDVRARRRRSFRSSSIFWAASDPTCRAMRCIRAVTSSASRRAWLGEGAPKRG